VAFVEYLASASCPPFVDSWYDTRIGSYIMPRNILQPLGIGGKGRMGCGVFLGR
jgi:hypothetical protein